MASPSNTASPTSTGHSRQHGSVELKDCCLRPKPYKLLVFEVAEQRMDAEKNVNLKMYLYLIHYDNK